MYRNEITDTIIEMTGMENTPFLRMKIEAMINEILAYTNRDKVEDDMFPIVCTVINDCLTNLGSCNIQSLSEGDMSVSYLSTSPFFGKLDSFKVIRGIN